MLEKMKEILAEQLGCDADMITEETSFKDDLGADSLDLLEVIMALEDEYGVEMNTEDLSDLNTVGDVMNYLKESGIPAVVATSTERIRAEAFIKRAGVYEYFTDCVYGDLIQASKPAPDIFLEAAAKIGQDPGDCVVLEDSSVGLQAAVAAGSYAIYIPDVAKVPDEIQRKADAKLADLSQVIGWIKEKEKR